MHFCVAVHFNSFSFQDLRKFSLWPQPWFIKRILAFSYTLHWLVYSGKIGSIFCHLSLVRYIPSNKGTLQCNFNAALPVPSCACCLSSWSWQTWVSCSWDEFLQFLIVHVLVCTGISHSQAKKFCWYPVF